MLDRELCIACLKDFYIFLSLNMAVFTPYAPSPLLHICVSSIGSAVAWHDPAAELVKYVLIPAHTHT